MITFDKKKVVTFGVYGKLSRCVLDGGTDLIEHSTKLL